MLSFLAWKCMFRCVFFKNNNSYSLNCVYDVRCEQDEVTGKRYMATPCVTLQLSGKSKTYKNHKFR